LSKSAKDLVYAKLHLNDIYKKKVAENAVLGISFGEDYVIAYAYYDGRIKQTKYFDTYVGVENFSAKLGIDA